MIRKLLAAATVTSASVIAALSLTAPAQAQAEPYIGQVMIFAGNFCPRGWAEADGAALGIAQNTALFSLLGVMYGGNGQTTFAVPDLRGRSPIGDGTGTGLPNYVQGDPGGATGFTLNTQQMPSHSHSVVASNVLADRTGPAVKYLGLSLDKQYAVGPPNVNMAADMISLSGGSQPVTHRGPYLPLKLCIAVEGIYPSRPD